MIILPDKNIPRTRILMPVHDCEWREPSLAQPKDQFGNQNRTRFILTARLSDGFVKWRGYFECRDDADAFLYSLVCGSLHYEKPLWKLPTPHWSPCIDEGVVYDQLLVETLLTSPTGSNQTYALPSDWNKGVNTVECIGGGSGGARGGIASTPGRGGGGGGAYAKSVNVELSAAATYQLGALGAGATVSNTAGGTGGDTWFNGTVITSCSAGAKGSVGTNAQTGSTGGLTATSTGTTLFAGGNGGSGQATNGAGGGGGGAGGGSAVGGNGTAGSGGNGGDGGRGDGVLGGTGATADGGTGNAGLEWTTYGSGGGGGGGAGTPTAGGPGGNYGAGGGGGGTAAISSSNGGAGTAGIIRITYTPYVGQFNMPMLGM